MISLLLASSLAFGQVRAPWMTEGRALPQCNSPESVQLVREQRWSEALALKERELAQVGPLLNDENVYVVWACLQSTKGALLGRLQRHAEAIALFDELLPAMGNRLGAEHPETMSAEFLGAATYGAAGRRQQQIRMLENLRPRVAMLQGPRTQEMAGLLRNLSLAHAWTGNHAAQLPLDREVLSIAEHHAQRPNCRSTMNDCQAELARARQHLADTMRRNGLAKEALPLAQAGYVGQAETRGKLHPNTLDARLIIASVYGELGELDKAIAIEREVLADAEKHLGADHPVTKKARGNLEYSMRGRK